MHWITILGIILIAAGTILACFGQNIMNRFDNKHLLRSVSEKTFRIDELVSNNNELFTRINEYQKRLLEKDETIHGLEVQVGESNVSDKKQPEDKQIEVGAQTIPEKRLSNEIVQAKRLYNEGKYDEAYRVADKERQKNPDFGLAYFILGTTEMQRKHYDKGEELLKNAIQFGLPDEDMAWAFHNLGVSSLRRKDYEKAREFLEKATGLSPNMEESQKTLDSIDDLQNKEKQGEDKKDSKRKKERSKK